MPFAARYGGAGDDRSFYFPYALLRPSNTLALDRSRIYLYCKEV
jgi:hypothetical protein